MWKFLAFLLVISQVRADSYDLACTALLHPEFIFKPKMGSRIDSPDPNLLSFYLGRGYEGRTKLIIENGGTTPISYVQKEFFGTPIYNIRALRLAQELEADLAPFKVIKILKDFPPQFEFIPGRQLVDIYNDRSFSPTLKIRLVGRYLEAIGHLMALGNHRHDLMIIPFYASDDDPFPGVEIVDADGVNSFTVDSQVLVDARNLDFYISDPL